MIEDTNKNVEENYLDEEETEDYYSEAFRQNIKQGKWLVNYYRRWSQ